MNRSFRDSVIGSRNNVSLASQHRRGLSLNGGPVTLPKDSSDDNNLDLFSKSRRSLSVPFSDESDGTPLFTLDKYYHSTFFFLFFSENTS